MSEIEAMRTEEADSGNQRVSTGIAGLDLILGGGYPRNRFYLIEGQPGTGKTTLALHFLLEAKRRQESSLYVTLSETKEELRDVAESHGWSLEGIGLYELASTEDKLQPEEQYTVFHPSEVELTETTQRICREVESLTPTRVVFDSLSEMRLLAGDPLRYRRQILALKQFFTGRQCTVLLLDDLTEKDRDLQLQTMSHGVIRLERVATDYGRPRRRLYIGKMRGVDYRDGYHDFTIRPGSLRVFPRVMANDSRGACPSAGNGRYSSGLPELDDLLGGGLDRGTSALLSGPSGVGKSTLGTQYAIAAAKRGERVACYVFEESRDTFVSRAAGLHMPLDGYLESGLVTVQQVEPTELAPGEFANQVRDAVESCHTGMILIDSLNGYLNAMPNERFLIAQMHELLSYLGAKGVVTLLVLTQHGLLADAVTPVEISYLADTLILLRYFEAYGSVRKAISVLKKRRGSHEHTIREFQITPRGPMIGAPLRNFRGVLTGVPEYGGHATELLGVDDGNHA